MLGNKPPYTTMQQLNLDWVLSKLKTLLRLVPDDGTVGQILRRTRDGAVWSDEQGGGGGGAVESVNGKTGVVVLDADDVGALPDDYTPPVTSVNGQTGAVTVSVPVQSVNGKTGAVVLDADDVGALPDDYTPPVTSVNGQTGAVTVSVPVQSVNGKTGAVVLDADDVGAAEPNDSGAGYCKMPDGTMILWGNVLNSNNGFIAVSFPVAFVNDNYIFSASPRYSTEYPRIDYRTVSQKVTKSGGVVNFKQLSSNASYTTAAIADWLAIGRWK